MHRKREYATIAFKAQARIWLKASQYGGEVIKEKNNCHPYDDGIESVPASPALVSVKDKATVFPHPQTTFSATKSGFQGLWDRQNSSKALADFAASGSLLPWATTYFDFMVLALGLTTLERVGNGAG